MKREGSMFLRIYLYIYREFRALPNKGFPSNDTAKLFRRSFIGSNRGASIFKLRNK